MTIRPSQSESYFSAMNALEDEGYEYIGTYESCNSISKKIFKRIMYRNIKSGETYYFDGMNNFNMTIKSISLRKFDLKAMSDWNISHLPNSNF